MKKIYILALTLVFALFYSCEEKSTPLKNSAYIAEAANNAVLEIKVEDEGASFGVTPRLANLSEADVEYEVVFGDEKVLKEYNEKNKTGFVNLPADYYKFESATGLIKAGSVSNAPIEIDIKPLDENLPVENTYAIPVTLVRMGSEDVLQSAKTVIVKLNRTYYASVLDLSGRNNYLTVDFAKDPSLKNLTQITIECLVYANSFQQAEPYISSILGMEGRFLLRFGDGMLKPDQLQLTGYTGLQQETPATDLFKTGQWHHVAASYDGKEIKVYKDGLLSAHHSVVLTEPIDLTGKYDSDFAFNIGKSSGYQAGRVLDGMISEARVWKVARTADEIKNNISNVDPKSPGLVAYWKLNGGDAHIIKDYTGNGFDAKPVRNATVRWKSGVKFPITF